MQDQCPVEEEQARLEVAAAALPMPTLLCRGRGRKGIGFSGDLSVGKREERSVTLYLPPSLSMAPQSSELSIGSSDKQRIGPDLWARRGKTWAAPLTSPSSVSTSVEGSTSPAGSSRKVVAAPRGTLDLGWRCGSRIGAGSYGCVYKAQDKSTGLIFAVKKAAVDQRESMEHSNFRDCLERELDICKGLRHVNIVSYLGYDRVDSCLYIYLEYAAGGSMASILTEFGPIVGDPLRKASHGLLEGLDYLHTRKPPVVHRDIKAANVLVDLDFRVKLADFGCSKCSDITKSFTTLGSIPWMAPEVINQENGHGRKADVWSLGCTLIEMVTAEKPWGNHMFDNVMFAMKTISMSDATPPLPEALCEMGRDLIRRCVQRRPEERPRTDQLLQHEFLEEPRSFGAHGAAVCARPSLFCFVQDDLKEIV